MRFRFVEEQRGAFPIDRLCQVLNVSSRGLRAFRNRPASRRQRTDMVVLAHIKEQSRLSLGRYGLSIQDVQEVIAMALGAEAITQTVEGRERYNVALRYPAALRQDPDAIARQVQVALPGGGAVPLSEAATVERTRGAASIRTENGQLAVYIFVDIAGRDLGGYVAEAQAAVAGEVTLPPGYSLGWSGQFEYLERAKARLAIVVPITLAVIFLLLFLNFRRLTETLIVMLSLPFALVGGVWLMWWMGFNTSVAIAVDFIALAGVAAETGVIMLIYLDHALAEVRAEVVRAGRAFTRADLDAAIMVGAVERVRPKMMTVVAIMAGLMPILWAHGTGSEVMSRIAVPMIGGMVSSTILTLVVIPAIYALIKGYGLDRHAVGLTQAAVAVSWRSRLTKRSHRGNPNANSKASPRRSRRKGWFRAAFPRPFRIFN